MSNPMETMSPPDPDALMQRGRAAMEQHAHAVLRHAVALGGRDATREVCELIRSELRTEAFNEDRFIIDDDPAPVPESQLWDEVYTVAALGRAALARRVGAAAVLCGGLIEWYSHAEDSIPELAVRLWCTGRLFDATGEIEAAELAELYGSGVMRSVIEDAQDGITAYDDLSDERLAIVFAYLVLDSASLCVRFGLSGALGIPNTLLDVLATME